MISSLIVGLGEIVSLLWRFCALTKAGAVGFGGGLGGPQRTPRPLPWVIDPDSPKGLVGVEGGPLAGLGGRAGSDIDGNLSEDASSDKVRGVKDVENPENFKNSEKRGSEACIPQAGFGFFYRRSSHNPKP